MRRRGVLIVILFLFSCSGLNWSKFADFTSESSFLGEIIGILDTSFNGKGFAIHNGAAGSNLNDAAAAVVIDSSGRILITGYSNNGTKDAMVIWRYNPDGSLDTSFGGGAGLHNF